MKTYKARVKINGNVVEIRVQARDYTSAKIQIEGQYGKGCIESLMAVH